MKSSKWAILNSTLAALAVGAALLVLLGVFHRPGDSRIDSTESGTSDLSGVPIQRVEPSSTVETGDPTGGGSSHASSQSVPTSAAKSLPPEAIADAFGWMEAAAAPTKETPTQPIIDAPWLSLIGSVTRVDGGRSYFFKNEKTGGVLQLAPAGLTDGWALEISEEGDYLIEKDNERYRVRRKK